jgi:hypothetical protein
MTDVEGEEMVATALEGEIGGVDVRIDTATATLGTVIEKELLSVLSALMVSEGGGVVGLTIPLLAESASAAHEKTEGVLLLLVVLGIVLPLLDMEASASAHVISFITVLSTSERVH